MNNNQDFFISPKNPIRFKKKNQCLCGLVYIRLLFKHDWTKKINMVEILNIYIFEKRNQICGSSKIFQLTTAGNCLVTTLLPRNTQSDLKMISLYWLDFRLLLKKNQNFQSDQKDNLILIFYGQYCFSDLHISYLQNHQSPLYLNELYLKKNKKIGPFYLYLYFWENWCLISKIFCTWTHWNTLFWIQRWQIASSIVPIVFMAWWGINWIFNTCN